MHLTTPSSGCNSPATRSPGYDMSAANCNTVTGCTFSGNSSSSDGVFMADASNNTFTGCTILRELLR